MGIRHLCPGHIWAYTLCARSVRTQLENHEGQGEVYRVLRRMEDEHVQQAQKWEYKKECLHQERQRLLEMAMSAFCKVVYVDRGLHHTTLVHGGGPGGDPQVISSAYEEGSPRAMVRSPRGAQYA